MVLVVLVMVVAVVMVVVVVLVMVPAAMRMMGNPCNFYTHAVPVGRSDQPTFLNGVMVVTLVIEC